MFICNSNKNENKTFKIVKKHLIPKSLHVKAKASSRRHIAVQQALLFCNNRLVGLPAKPVVSPGSYSQQRAMN